MDCPKCKAKIGVMDHEIILESGIIHCTRCIICGYLSQPYHPAYKRDHNVRQNRAMM